MPPNPYYLLSPRNATASRTINPSHPIPKAAREFGYLPDINKFSPGDLLLFHHIEPPLFSNMIIKAQSEGGLHEDDAKWHHAAVYIGDYTLCEAQIFGGVKLTPLYNYIGDYEIRVRRDQQLNNDECYKLAINSLIRLGDSYSLGSIWKLWIGSKRGFWRHPVLSIGDVESTICSKLYADAYAFTMGRLIVQHGTGLTTPAELSSTTKLTDISVDWLKVE